ncbi:uncharacterized protein LOC125709424 isoform X2 [Brienomyrus brachyistius]|uniref:uncharacterized protein LOC125709424 isoform X2 n=1 Tax=Brienomyrus brachyistius TaxID=42636 RepID=UPI0020B2E736|nr:uncharacterized protein LOC125709424 isoform X2 [Brienomyrus brachyistius]
MKAAPLWILVSMAGCCLKLAADPLIMTKYFLSGERDWVILQNPDLTNGTEFSWEWTSHNGKTQQTEIAKITLSDDGYSWIWGKGASFNRHKNYGIQMAPKFANGGLFIFSQTKPTRSILAQTEVIAVRVVGPQSDSIIGSDVSFSCEASRLPDSVTLQWEKKENHIPNTTLLHVNTAHIIIHSVDMRSSGEYNCTFRKNGHLLYYAIKTLEVKQYSIRKPYTLYREASNSSEVTLINQRYDWTSNLQWYWRPTSRETAKNKQPVGARMIFPSQGFDGYYIPLHISPVTYEESGMYDLYINEVLFNTITLVTLKVTLDLPGWLFGNKTLVLTCEVSETTNPLTLAWLRMEGNRGVLEKREALNDKHLNRKLQLSLSNPSRDRMHWACAVFTGRALRATASLQISLPDLPAPSASQGNIIPIVAAVGPLSAVFFLAALVLFCKRRHAAAIPLSPREVQNDLELVPAQTENMYSNVIYLHEDTGNPIRTSVADESQELHYAALVLRSLSSNSASPASTMVEQSYAEQTNDVVIYSDPRTV